jgi:hypothetical protein
VEIIGPENGICAAAGGRKSTEGLERIVLLQGLEAIVTVHPSWGHRRKIRKNPFQGQAQEADQRYAHQKSLVVFLQS